MSIYLYTFKANYIKCCIYLFVYNYTFNLSIFGNFSKSYGHSASVMRSQADSVRNVVTEELELVPDYGFTF